MLAGCGGGDDGDRSPSRLQREAGGDEGGNRVPVRVVVDRGRVRASDDEVPSFLALRFRMVNRLERRVRVTVAHDGDAVGRVTVPAGGREVLDVEGQRTGALAVRAPEGTAAIAVRPGAG